ncbi:MAG TPA: Hsp20/alpha crystallin family protein [Verrucomicrobiae bacterium]
MSTVTQKEERPVTPQRVQTEAEQAYVRPEVNILETKEGYVLEAEMPGVTKDGLDIGLEENVLTIVGRRGPAPSGNAVYRESNTADFRRVFELDPSIESGKISARIEQGILTLTLPKAEKVKPRKITVA